VASNCTWTIDSLAAHIRGELDVNPDAAGGTVPERMEDLIRECGIRLWSIYDWRFKLVQGTLTLAADDATKAVPADFEKLDSRWMKNTVDSEGVDGLRWTEDVLVYQKYEDSASRDGAGAIENGTPLIACIANSNAATFAWEFMVTPPADDDYSYKYWYTLLNPWDGASLADDATPAWPMTFNMGWHYISSANCHQAFGSEERAMGYWKQYAGWRKLQLQELDESITTSGLEPISGNYNDFSPQLYYDPSKVFPS